LGPWSLGEGKVQGLGRQKWVPTTTSDSDIYGSAISMLSLRRLKPQLLRMYRARRRACRMRRFDGRRPSRKRSSDKEAENKFQSTTRDADIVQPSPCHQHKTWGLPYSECTKPGGAHVGYGCSTLPQGLWGKKGAGTRRLEMCSMKYYMTLT
jgi:hypothetical protein